MIPNIWFQVVKTKQSEFGVSIPRRKHFNLIQKVVYVASRSVVMIKLSLRTQEMAKSEFGTSKRGNYCVPNLHIMMDLELNFQMIRKCSFHVEGMAL